MRFTSPYFLSLLPLTLATPTLLLPRAGEVNPICKSFQDQAGTTDALIFCCEKYANSANGLGLGVDPLDAILLQVGQILKTLTNGLEVGADCGAKEVKKKSDCEGELKPACCGKAQIGNGKYRGPCKQLE